MRVEDEVIVYDQHGMFSAPRVWFMLRLYGMEKVRVLQGGLPAWKSEAFATQTMAAMPQPISTPTALGQMYRSEANAFQSD